ncbi:MAG TPA: DUF924 family protein [Xanthomonadaceae bacterium]
MSDKHLAEGLRIAGLPDGRKAPDEPPQGGMREAAWVGDVLRFWFEELSEQDWFAKNAALDARIRERFLSLHESLAGDAVAVDATLRAILAAVIALDQFPRNMFRSNTRAYATDATARRWARSAIERGFDAGLADVERLVLYMPLEHSEDAQDQALALDLMEPLGHAEWTREARMHKEVIDRFGRFPHRNAMLGRESTAEETEFLGKPLEWY